MLWNLLDAASDTTTNGDTTGQQIMMYVILGVIIVVFAVWIFISSRKNKQMRAEYDEQLNAIRPGHKVKTAGGICGIVVEVCDDNTVIIETGSEASGKSYVKMDKESIAQTDAKGPTQIAREEAAAAKQSAKNGGEEQSAEAPAETSDEEPTETENSDKE